jgi:hypothetical protein
MLDEVARPRHFYASPRAGAVFQPYFASFTARSDSIGRRSSTAPSRSLALPRQSYNRRKLLSLVSLTKRITARRPAALGALAAHGTPSRGMHYS